MSWSFCCSGFKRYSSRMICKSRELLQCVSRIYSASIVEFKLKLNGKVNRKVFIDLPDRDSTSLFNSNKASSRYFDRNLNYLTTILHVCYAVYLQSCFCVNFAKEYVGQWLDKQISKWFSWTAYNPNSIAVRRQNSPQKWAPGKYFQQNDGDLLKRAQYKITQNNKQHIV